MDAFVKTVGVSLAAIRFACFFIVHWCLIAFVALTPAGLVLGVITGHLSEAWLAWQLSVVIGFGAVLVIAATSLVIKD